MNIQTKIENLSTIALLVNDLDSQQLIENSLEIDQSAYQQILGMKTKGNNNICQTTFENGQLGYQCFDCSSCETHIICQDCLQIEKHKGHLIMYKYANEGCCDCGDQLNMKKESFCDKHQLNSDIIQIIQLDEIICDQYRQFIQITFALLISKTEQITDLPSQYNEQKHIQLLDLEQTEEQQKYVQSINEIQSLFQLITQVLNKITEDNIPLSLLTSKYFKQPIDKDIQQVIKLRHYHTGNHFKISQESQICDCSILELQIKFSVFMNQFQNEIYYFYNMFHNLRVDEDFQPFLSRLLLKFFNYLYIPIRKYKLISESDTQVVIINRLNFPKETQITEIIDNFSKHQNFIEINFKNSLISATQLFQYSSQLQGMIILELLKFQNQPHSQCLYKSFKFFQQKMLDLPLCNYHSLQETERFYSLLTRWFTSEAYHQCSAQIVNLIDQEEEQLAQNTFNVLQKNSLFIYILTKAFPSSITSGKVQKVKDLNKDKHFLSSQYIQIIIFVEFRRLLFNIIQQLKNHKNSYLIQMFQAMLNYYFKKQESIFKIDPLHPLQSLLSNQVLSDRNFILILSNYLQNFDDPKEALENLLQTSGKNIDLFKSGMLSMLQRTLLNYVIYKTKGNTKLYKGQEKFYFLKARYSEVALEQVDITFIQIYAYIFGANGINDIINQFQIIGSAFNFTTDAASLVARICQSDYDIIQCQGFNSELKEQGVKGLNKLFQTIFFAQTYYNSKDLIQLLQTFSYDTNFDIQRCIISSCDINPDNDSLQLKKSLQPAQYEPVFAQQVPSLKDKIEDKLKTEGDYFKLLFGSALANELTNNKSTLTVKRQAILQAIAQDEKQIILNEIIENIKIYYNQNELQSQNLKAIISLLEDKAVYINLLFQSNKIFGPNIVIQQGLQWLLKMNYQIIKFNNIKDLSSVFCNYVLLLDESSILDIQLRNDQEYQLKKSQLKKQYLQDKFKCMSNKYQSQVKKDIQNQDDQLCSFCKLNFNKDDLQYKAVLIQETNIHDYQKQTKLENQLTFDILKYDISFCVHIFHGNCLKQQRKGTIFGESAYYYCPVCSMPYNFCFFNPTNLITFKNQEILEDLDTYLKIVPEDLYLEYFNKYTFDNELQVSLVINELFTCSLCNLLQKLLGNTEDFYFKKQHLLLQEIIHFLRLAYQEHQQSILEFANLNTNELLFGLINAVQNYLIASNSLKEFEDYLKSILDQHQLVFDLITKPIINHNVPSLQMYNQQEYKQQIKSRLFQFLRSDFKQFLVEYCLTPCQKCKFLPISRIKGLEQEQYFCLICFKKMCSQNCGKPFNNQGNLTRHAIKKHKSKTIYLQIRSSKIIIMIAPHVLYCDQTLYQNLISEQPIVETYGSSYYENFKLNQKAIDMIVDIISGEKYLHKMFANTSKIEIKKL